jgi:hypothetical protein
MPGDKVNRNENVPVFFAELSHLSSHVYRTGNVLALAGRHFSAMRPYYDYCRLSGFQR